MGSAGAYRVQKKVLEPLELELQVAPLTWVLRTKLWFSGRTMCMPNH